MKGDQAAKIINGGATFRPGWKLHAEDISSYGMPGCVFVVADVPSVDTSYVDREGTYYKPMATQPQALVDVSKVHDIAGLAAMLLRELVQPYQEHEDREFLRFWDGEGWVAPLHPHTDEGERAWARQPAVSAH